MNRLSLTLLAFLLASALAGTAAAQDEKKPHELPPGHPPMTVPPASTGGLPPVPEGSGTGEMGLAWKVPEGWTAETPSSSMRRAQYRITGEAGDGVCVVYYFGPGQGGGARANVERWAGQFTQPDGGSSLEKASIREREVEGMTVTTIEVTGTYSGSMTMGGAQQGPQPGQMLLGAVVEGPDANWFFKLTGPEATLTAQRDVFAAMIGSLHQGE